ncbi:HYALP Hyaluronidase, partial [Calyptomena viridis]|nr:HYALP Hyaluronidase [Calyptomena viridis]
ASVVVFTTLLVSSCSSLNIRARPLVSNSPFLSIWNAPTELCTERTGVQLNMNFFPLIGSTLKTSIGQNITLFYPDRLGYYPYKNEVTGEAFNGGLPQLALLENHLKKAKEDIQFYIPSDEQLGLAVIDWENWRPVWIRNWGLKDIYRQESIELVQQRDLSLSEAEARTIAKMEFEAAAKSFMLETLKLGIEMKPNRLWGYYLYPDCYNYDYKQNPHNYTGTCLDIEIERNNELNWLWEKSTALYPSVYLETALRSSRNAQLFVRNRVQEAIRTSYVSNSTHPLPVFVYTRPVFTDVYEEYLSEVKDFQYTLGNDILNITAAEYNTVTAASRYDLKANYTRTFSSSSSYKIRMFNLFCLILLLRTLIQMTHEKKFDCHCYAGHSCEPRVDINDIHYLHACISEDICIQISSNSLYNIEASEEKILSNRTAFSFTSESKVTLSTHP